MAEEVKKSRPAPDPNSAKYKLGQIAAKAYSDAMEAKKRGEMVGWCASNFPVEIPKGGRQCDRLPAESEA